MGAGMSYLRRMRGRRLVLDLLLGLALALAVGSQFLRLDWSLLVLLPAYIIFVLAGIVAADKLVVDVIEPRLAGYTPLKRWAWIATCLLAGLYLVYALGITVYPHPNQIRITATGQKNPQAGASEVLLAQIYTGSRAPWWGVEHYCRGDWLQRDGFLNSIYNQPSELVCTVYSDQPMLVRFGVHPWSGEMQLDYYDQRTSLDLYAPSGGTQDVFLAVSLSQGEKALRILLLTVDTVALGLLLLAFSLWVAVPQQSSAAKARHSVRFYRWWQFALPMLVAWLIYLLAYWPGFLSTDSLDQFTEIAAGQLNNWHPAFHTMTLWLVTRLGFSPAPVVLLQILLLSGLLGWGFSLMQRHGAPAWSAWAGAIFLALSPATGLMLINPWKDIAYSIAVIWLVLLIFQVVVSRGEHLQNRFFWLWLGLAAALVALYRHNGAPVAIGSLLLLLVGYPRRWKPLLPALALCIALWLLVSGPVYRLAGVNTRQETGGQNLGIPGWAVLLADYHRQNGAELLSEELALIEHVAPGGQSFDLVELARNAQSAQQMALRLTRQRPDLSLEFLLRQVGYVLTVFQPPLARLGYVELRIYENPFGIQPAPVLPVLQPVLKQLTLASEKPFIDWLFWRNAFWMYVLVISAAAAAIRRRSWQVLVVIVPVLFNALPLAVFSGGQIARYILPTLLAGPLLAGWLILERQPSTNDKLDQT